MGVTVHDSPSMVKAVLTTILMKLSPKKKGKKYVKWDIVIW